MANSQNTAEIVIRAVDAATAVLLKISEQAQRTMDQTKRSADHASRGLESLKMAAVGVAAGFGAKGAWDWLVKSNAQMEQAAVGFETMLGSAEKAKAFLDNLQQFAAKTPFEFTELRTAATRMLAFGFDAEKVLPTLTAVGDATSALGLGQEGINRVIVALGQMKAKAKVSADEMLQLTEAGIPAWDILAKEMGKSTAEVMKLSEKGLIPADKAIQALVKGMEERFPDMMKKQSETLGGMLSNIKDFSEMAGRTLGKGMFDQVKPAVKAAMDTLKQMTQSGDLERWGKRIGDAFAYAVTSAKQLLPILAGVGTAMAFSAAMNGVAAALKAVGRSATLATIATDGLAVAIRSNPIGWISAAIGLAIGAYVTYKTTIEGTTAALEGSVEKARQDREEKEAQVVTLKEHISSLNDLKNQYGQLSEAISGGKLKSEEMAVAKEKLRMAEEKLIPVIGQEGLERIKQSGNYKQAFDTEISAMQEKLDAEKKAVDEAKKIEFERTKNLMNTTIWNIETIKAEQNAYGAWARAKTGLYELLKTASEKAANIPLLPKALVQSQKEQAEMYQRLIDDTVTGSKVSMLRKLDEELSKLRKNLISLGNGTPDYGNSVKNAITDWGDIAGKTKEKLLSLGSVFSQVSQAIASDSESAMNEAKDSLEELAQAATKLGASDLAKQIRALFDKLPEAVHDKTGQAGKALITGLLNIFSGSESIFEGALNKIVIQADGAMAKLSEKLDEADKEIKKKADEMNRAMSDAMDKAGKIYTDMQDRLDKAKKDHDDRVAEVTRKRDEDLVAAEKERAEKITEINTKLSESIQKLQDDYDKALADTADRLKDWTGLFDEVPKLAKDSMDKMSKNLRDQVDRFDLFYKMLGNLSKRGVDQGLIKELKAMGPKAADQVLALYQSSESQLNEYVDLWKTRSQLAGEEAVDQLEGAREDMADAIKKANDDAATELEKLRKTWDEKTTKIRADAQRELDKLETDWSDSIKSIRKDTKEKLGQLADEAEEHGAEFVTKLLLGIKSKYPELVATINEIMSAMNLQPEQVANAPWQTTLDSYKTNTAAGYAEIARAGEVYNQKMAAGDTAGAEAAHTWANQVRDAMGISQYDRDTGASTGISSSHSSGGSSSATVPVGYIVPPSAPSAATPSTPTLTPTQKWYKDNFGSVPAGVFHEGGEVTDHGRKPFAPNEVPVLAKEGEIIGVPGNGASLDFSKVVSLLEKILAVLKDNVGVKFDQLQKVENQNIYNGQDSEDLARSIAREVLIAVPGVNI